MKAMTKQQLADCAGVTLKTLSNWCAPYREQLEAMGVQKKTKVLPPKAARWIADKFMIDIDP